MASPGPRLPVPPETGQAALTQRELEVLRLIARGLNNAAVADALSVSVHTVKFHLGSIYRKLGASNRTEAALAFVSLEGLNTGAADGAAGTAVGDPAGRPNGSDNRAEPPASPSAERPAAPLSYEPERVLLLERMAADRSACKVAHVLRIDGEVDPAALRRAFDLVVARHEPSRTIISTAETPTQPIGPERPFELPVVDLRAFADAEAAAEAEAIVDELAARPFHLERDPTIRAVLLHVAAGDDRLVVVCHSSVSDETSPSIVVSELVAAYDALVDGREPELSELSIAYSDSASRELEWLGQPGVADELAFWREQLEGAPERIDLPADRPRPAAKSGRGGEERRRSLDPELGAGVRALAHSHGVSPLAVHLAAFDTLVHRYTGVEDVVVGTPATVRDDETMPLIGRLGNTLVLRTDLSGEPTFAELLTRVGDTVSRAFAHQNVPFEKLVDELGLDRDPSYSPLVQLLLAYEPAAPAPELGGHAVTLESVEGRWWPFDLAIWVRERLDGGADLTAGYSSDLFEPETVDRLLGHLETLLRGAVADPSRPIAALPLLTAEERHVLLEEWNATELAVPDACVHELVAATAERQPGTVAVAGSGRELTYGELESASNRLARHLAGRGVGEGSLVAVCMERVPELLVALLGVLKAGAAYVPVDPTYPHERQALMLSDSNASLVLTQEALKAGVPLSVQTVCMDTDWPEIAREPDTPPGVRLDGESLAYVIYTSGSTGRPKGVQIAHRALTNFLTTMARQPGFERDDVLVAVTTLSFDIAGLELYLPLTCGGRVVLATPQTAADPLQLGALIHDAGATVVQATPTTWKMLLDSDWTPPPGLKALCGGEALPQLLADRLLTTGIELWNMYGPTETTIWSTVRRLQPGDQVTIGRPIGNTRLYILDSRLEPVPIGVPADLYIGGLGVARGYLGQPELTAERFVADPFARTPGARMYRTGDLARYRANGDVEFLGRLDHQVKVRGYRIELGDVEAALARHPSVTAAVAAAHSPSPGETMLIAYVTQNDELVRSNELRAFVGERLPSFMVPSRIVTLEAFPLTPSGKIDRRALPAPSGDRDVSDDEIVGPRNELERRLVEIWEDVIGIRPIGVTDDFFELGATSIVAARLFARIEHELGTKLPLAPIFQAPTIEQLVRLIEDGAQQQGRWTSLVPMQPRGTKPPVFCVHGGAGTILHLQPLVRRLGYDQPFYGLQARGLNGGVAPHRKVEDMAVHYLSEMRTVQPHGPYYLAGYCFGGIVAFDMAQRLLADGEEVATLVMFNAPSPLWRRTIGGFSGQASRAHLRVEPQPLRPFHQRALGAFKSPRKIAHLAQYYAWRARRRYLEPIFYRTLEIFDLPVPEFMRDEFFLHVNAIADRVYEPSFYPGEIVMFHGEGLYDDPTIGWTPFAERVVTFEVPGIHTRGNRESMAEPKVAFVAERMEAYLAEARARYERVPAEARA